ncbi:MAG: hypothetical protein AB8F95_04615, partial [Bacteroidia bacterium]
MKNQMLFFGLLWAAMCCVLTAGQAQHYNQLTTNNTGLNANFEYLSSLAENPNTGELISASSVLQPGTTGTFDIMIQVYDGSGAIISNFQVGESGLSEMVTGVEL